MELLGRARLFLELFLYLRVDVCDRDELQRNRFTRPLVYSFVSNRRTGSPEFPGSSIAIDRDAVVLKESCLFHIVLWPAARTKAKPPTISFNFNFGHELLILTPAGSRTAVRSNASGYPAWIRTKNNASKGRCVTVTPRGISISDFRLAIFNSSAMPKIKARFGLSEATPRRNHG